MQPRLTTKDIGAKATNGANVHNDTLGSHQPLMEEMHHAHWAKDIDLEHLLHLGYLRIGCWHGVANST